MAAVLIGVASRADEHPSALEAVQQGGACMVADDAVAEMPGQLVEIVFANPDVMQHNFVLGAPGSLATIGEAGDRLATSPTGLAQGYVPDLPQVLYSTKLLEPGQTVIFQFRAPTTGGQYPYVCTFPAHWRTMNGIIEVRPAPSQASQP